MSDIIDRLRNYQDGNTDLMVAAANEIERMRDYLSEAADEIERLRMALDLIANHPVTDTGMWEVGAKEMQRLAHAALSGEFQMPPMEDDDVKA